MDPLAEKGKDAIKFSPPNLVKKKELLFAILMCKI